MLGTGYGECKNKKTYSKEYRGMGGVVIDDSILIDAPADVFETAASLGFDEIFNTVTDVLISHSHPGHFSPSAIAKLGAKRRIRVFASREVLDAIQPNANIEKFEISAFMQFRLGKFTVAPLPSNHSTDNVGEECFNFLLVSDKSLFYALDGGYINHRAFSVLKMIHLDAIIFDCAMQESEATEGLLHHNDLDTAAKIINSLNSNLVCCLRCFHITGSDSCVVLLNVCLHSGLEHLVLKCLCSSNLNALLS